MNKALTPRAQFISDPNNVKNHRRILDDATVQKSIDTAMAEYVRAVVSLGSTHDLAAAGSQQAAAASFHLITGAYQFLEVYGRLAEPYQKPPNVQPISESLDK